MSRIGKEWTVVAACAVLAGCSTVSLAPGAEQVTTTDRAADVASCASLGELTTPPMMVTDSDAWRQLQNETQALGGDTLLFTSPMHRTGVAYRCHGMASATTGQAASPAAAAPLALAPVEVVQAQLDAFNRHDLEGVLKLYANDVQVVEYPDRPLISGKDALRERVHHVLEGSQAHLNVARRMAFDRFVIDRQELTGTSDGSALGAVALYEIRDGHIVRVTWLHP